MGREWGSVFRASVTERMRRRRVARVTLLDALGRDLGLPAALYLPLPADSHVEYDKLHGWRVDRAHLGYVHLRNQFYDRCRISVRASAHEEVVHVLDTILELFPRRLILTIHLSGPHRE